ncbi:MAG: Ig-like domain-containing protein [Bacteroidales bacterium]|nr:Ig-like domain-containing protein [Bacteroidales bacterium]
MKRTVIIFAAALVALMAIAGCKKMKTKGQDDDIYVAAKSVSLNRSQETIEIDGTVTLYATVEPWNATYKYVTWTSSNEYVATVSEDGVVKGVHTGNATITATTTNDLTATCKIEVVAEKIAVTGISIEPSSNVIKVDGGTRLTVKFSPSNATNHHVTWSSDRDDIASVDNDGLVTGHGQGTATITAISEDGGKEATATVKVVQPFTSISITAPTQSDYHFKDGKFKYVVGETFQLQAVGEPSDSDDEIEYRVYGWGNNNYLNYFNISETGLVEAIGPYTSCKVSARSKADKSVEAVFTFNVLAAPEHIRLVTRQEDAEVQVYEYYPNYRRNTQYLGRGVTQKFRVLVEPSTAPQDVRIFGEPSWGIVNASITDGILSVEVPYNTAASTTSNEVKFTITLEATSNGHTDEFTFKVCRYDPYKVKVGDLIAKDGKIYDGGYRGYGVFEDSIRKDGDDNSIIAWLGDKHTTEDPFWSMCKPSEGLKTAKGAVIHGIAIPVNIDHLYRTSETSGEYYYDKDGNDNFILDSNNLPTSWLTTDDRKNLLRSTSAKHSAIFNTCVHVYTNQGRGSTWEIRPANFFVDYHTVFPGESGHSASDIPKDNYSFWGAFGYNYSGSASFGNYAKKEGSIAGTYMTTWLWPTIADFYSIFTGGDNPTGLQTFKESIPYSASEKQREIFVHSAKQAGFTLTYDYWWWLANESGRESSGDKILRLTQATIQDDNSGLTINTNVLHKNDTWKAYVLPIRYF